VKRAALDAGVTACGVAGASRRRPATAAGWPRAAAIDPREVGEDLRAATITSS
jgi:hypothetical protein